MKKVVLITGASAGISMETAILLAQNGYVVYGASYSVGVTFYEKSEQKSQKPVT